MYKYFLLYLILWGKVGAAQVTYDTVQAHFALNQSSLDETDKQLLSLLVTKGVITARTNLIVIGYADYLGSESQNLELSETRAKSVSDYLISLGISKELIKLCTGKGSIKREEKDKNGFPADRRVDIVMESTKAEAPKAVNTPPPEKAAPSLAPDLFLNTPRGSSFVLEDLLFYPNRHEVTDETLPILDRLVEDMKSHPDYHIRIEGHVCCIHSGKSMAAVSYLNTVYDAVDYDVPAGTEAEDEPVKLRYRTNTLSRNRAKYIYEYLVKKGIAADRMSYIGYGNLRPVVKDEKTPEDEAKNRRVEIRIMER